MNRFTKTFLVVCTLATLPGCQAVGTPKATVNKYLKTLSNSGVQASQNYLCWQGEDAKGLRIELPTEIKKWEVTGEEDETSQRDSDSHYKLIPARIESVSVGGFTVTKTWTFQVWKSDDFYESSKRAIDNLNQTLADNEKILSDTRKMLREPNPSPTATRLASPAKREQVSSKPYCILAVEPTH